PFTSIDAPVRPPPSCRRKRKDLLANLRPSARCVTQDHKPSRRRFHHPGSVQQGLLSSPTPVGGDRLKSRLLTVLSSLTWHQTASLTHSPTTAAVYSEVSADPPLLPPPTLTPLLSTTIPPSVQF
ncbi:NAD(P)H-quinone oxidoreductase subunit K chloroplastic, partial [Dissostichus eleginoides]